MFCKKKYTDDLKNCKTISEEMGLWIACQTGYYLSNDSKRIEFPNCLQSIFGVCQKCNEGYYLDKTGDKCKEARNNFAKCQLSLDGANCERYTYLYYFTEKDKKWVSYYFCEESDENYVCTKCIEGYYKTLYDNACTPEENCKYGDKDLGICTQCPQDYYLDLKDGKCKSN